MTLTDEHAPQEIDKVLDEFRRSNLEFIAAVDQGAQPGKLHDLYRQSDEAGVAVSRVLGKSAIHVKPNSKTQLS